MCQPANNPNAHRPPRGYLLCFQGCLRRVICVVNGFAFVIGGRSPPLLSNYQQSLKLNYAIAYGSKTAEIFT